MAGELDKTAVAPTAAKKSKAPAEPAAPVRVRSIAEIEADIEASREQLVETIVELQVAAKKTVDPRRIISVQITKVRTFYVDEYGGVRPERVAITVGVVVGFVVLRRVKRRIFS
ncbi:MAG: DUF3618 domain-containing protein [Actinomycetes bacterium]